MERAEDLGGDGSKGRSTKGKGEESACQCFVSGFQECMKVRDIRLGVNYAPFIFVWFI
jgi:hypothetical protein